MHASLRIELFPGDIARSLAFYAALGFDISPVDPGPPRYASARMDSVRIGFAEAEPVDPARRAYPVMTEIVIDVADVELLRDHIVAAGVALTDDLRTRPWGLMDFRVTDPDGYYLRFTARRRPD